MAKLIDLTGNKYHQLLVLEKGHRSKTRRWYWHCQCDCGQFTVVAGSDLKNGHTKSCGCLFLKAITTHGHSRRGKRTLTYNSWAKMMARCYNKNCVEYKWYGKIGRTVCKRWHKYENFLLDMGERVTKNYTIDRHPSSAMIYNKKNCRWATKAQQSRNQMGQPDKSSKYKGVRKHGKGWTAQICHEGKCIYLGSFRHEEDAAIAYNRRAKQLWGDDAYYNNLP